MLNKSNKYLMLTFHGCIMLPRISFSNKSCTESLSVFRDGQIFAFNITLLKNNNFQESTNMPNGRANNVKVIRFSNVKWHANKHP
jgi:hypothetical protein